MQALDSAAVSREQLDPVELPDPQQPRAQAVVDVVVVVGDLVGEIGHLCLERRLPPQQEALAQFAQRARVLLPAVLQDALARLEAQVQSVECRVALLEFVDDAQRLQVVLEATVAVHARVQRVLPGVSEWRVAEVVCQRDRLDQVLVQPQIAADRAADLRDFDRMREPGTEQIAFVVDENLRLVFEPAKGGAVNDAVAIALELAARARPRLGVPAAAAGRRIAPPAGERSGRAHAGSAFHLRCGAQPVHAASVARNCASVTGCTRAAPNRSSSTNSGAPWRAFLSMLISST